MSGQLENTLPGKSASAPTREELVERAVALRPQLLEGAPQADRDRRVDDANIEALTAAGLLSLLVPRRFGGLETDAQTVLEVISEIGRGDPAAAWIAGILNASTHLVSLFPERAQEEVWGADPNARICSPIQPGAEFEKVDGGLRVTGKWPYASGCLYSQWAVTALILGMTEKGPDIQLMLMPMSELTVEDTWYMGGMRGTGSNTLVAKDVFVPDHRIMPFVPALNGMTLAEGIVPGLYTSSLAGILVVVLLGPQIGIADQVLDYVREKAPSRAVPVSIYTEQSESVPFQLDLAEAATRIDTAKLHARRASADIDAFALTGRLPDDLHRARLRMDYAWASKNLQEAVDLLVSAHGTSSFADVSPLQRLWRDLNVANRHALFGLDVPAEMYGRTLLGKDPKVSPMV